MNRTRTPRKNPTGRVAWVGAGPGDAGTLTVRGAELLAAAEVVVVDPALSDGLPARLYPGAEIVAPHSAPGAVGRQVLAAARAGRDVVRLAAGDPFLDGAAAAEAEPCAKAGVAFEIVPAVSLLLGAAIYAGVPLTGARLGVDVVAAPTPEDAGTDWGGLAASRRTVVFPATATSVGKLARRLLECGRAGDTPVAMTWAAGRADQHTVVSTLEAIENEAADTGLQDVAVVVVGEVVRLRERLSWFESRPLFGWRVLVPRTKEQAGELSDRLRAFGAVPVEVPTIAVEPPRTPAPMERAVRGLVSGRYQWAAFTSVNAVRAVCERFQEVGLDARAFAGVKVAAVGEATAGALVDFGIRPDLVPSGEQSSEGLLADWPPYDDVLDPIDRVFLPRADIATETLVAGLKERGWAVDDVTAYRTVRAAPPAPEIREAIKAGGFDAAVFTSSSTVRNLVGIAGKPHAGTVIAVIGPQTARTAAELGLRVDVEASSPSAAALADALAEMAAERRDAGETARPSVRAAAKGKKPR
ncbi:MAG: uroporphyrinogen-III synthase [Mycobacteriales bacterium]